MTPNSRLKSKTPIKRDTEKARKFANQRSELKRTSGLARTGRLPKMSASKKREKKQTDKPRRAVRVRIGKCALCLCERPVNELETHEIFGGAVRSIIVKLESLQLPVCADRCHRIVQYMPKAQQMALKARIDGAHYDRSVLKEIFGGEKLTEVDVIKAAIEVGEQGHGKRITNYYD
jgi:hypothetical protein